MTERKRARPAQPPRRPPAATLSAHEAIVGESLADASAALAKSGVDPKAIARAAKARAAAVIAQMGASPFAQGPIDFGPLVEWRHPQPATRSLALLLGISPGTGGPLAANLVSAHASSDVMRDAGIRDGDLIVADRLAPTRDGDIAMLRVKGHGLLLRRIRIEARAIVRLESAADGVAHIDVVDPSDVASYGVVVARAGRLSR